MNFIQQLGRRMATSGSLVCIGLDSDRQKLPKGQGIVGFNKAIIDATHDLVCAYKLNSAFYEADGAEGIEALHATFAYLRTTHPDIPTILDAKRGDIGSTSEAYARFAFDYLGAGSVTVQPYLGREAVEPFLTRKDRGIIVLCRTSNPGAGELQDLAVGGRKLYQVLAENVCDSWNGNKNCLLVVGGTYPDELADVRRIVGDDIPFLVPGIGAQGGDASKVIAAGVNDRGTGLIISSSREIIFASNGADFAEAARAKTIVLKDTINKARRANERQR